jgi:hypothetical protein
MTRAVAAVVAAVVRPLAAVDRGERLLREAAAVVRNERLF